MRRIYTSGGLELGVPDTGPWIDIVPVPSGRVVSLEEGAEAAQRATWYRWSREVVREMHIPTLIPPGMRGVAGISEMGESGQSVGVRFLWSR
ncbi:MAG: hypothetical protein J7M39_09525, partial [Anaerolineae bacterium]|nr:hypothetical protein [Anaerolineae bacterium]